MVGPKRIVSGIGRRMTYANVTATLAVFLALGGGAYAAIDLVGRNDIKSKHIKKGQVKSSDVKDDGLTGTDVDEDSLELPPQQDLVLESWHEVGTAGEPSFDVRGLCDWDNVSPTAETVAFARDVAGIVHLKGLARAFENNPDECGGFPDPGFGQDTIFFLPPGYRPAGQADFPIVANDAPGRLTITPDGEVQTESVEFADATVFVTLNGITFRCAPSGTAGCP
jgi:hypothetical protein